MALCCVMPAKALEVSAHSAILMDGDTGRVLYEKSPDERSLIASTTKIMTALVALETGGMDETVTVPAEAAGIEGSSMYLKAGETLTRRDLLYGMMLSSGNDAAVTLAISWGDSLEDFVGRMNARAQALGLSQTFFANPNGLDDENYSTARELAILTQEALRLPEFRQVVASRSYQAGNRQLVNHNKLLWRYPNAIGVKTGFTKRAGRILVGAAERNGRLLISVTINAPSDWSDHQAMLDYGFSLYQETEIIVPGQILDTVPVMETGWDTWALEAETGVTAWLLPEEKPECRVYGPRFLYAPAEHGTEAGYAEVFLGETPLGRAGLRLGEPVIQ